MHTSRYILVKFLYLKNEKISKIFFCKETRIKTSSAVLDTKGQWSNALKNQKMAGYRILVAKKQIKCEEK